MADDQFIPNFAGVLSPEEPAPLQELPAPDLSLPANVPVVGPTSTADIIDTNLNNFKSALSRSYDPNYLVQPIKYDDPAYEKLKTSYSGRRGDLFGELGFFPGRNNEDRYARSLDNWQKLGVAGGQMFDLAKETFASQWQTEADFWGNLSTGNIKEAFIPFEDQEELKRMYDSMQEATKSNYIPLTLSEQEGQFGFGKFATSLGQFGFTLGTIGAFATQMAIEWGAAALLAPETSGASLGAAAVSSANKIKKLFTLGEAYRNLSKLENTAQSVNKIRQAYDYVRDTKNLKAGFGSFYGFTKQWNAAAGEAKFEAAFSYGEYMDRIREEKDKNNEILTYTEKQDREKTAMKIAKNNGITNVGLLFAMNKLNMSNLFRGPFSPQRRMMSELFTDNIGSKLAKTGSGWVPKSSLGLFTKQGGLEFGKKFGGWFVDSAWEGVQEVVQGISSKGWNDYYSNQYDRDPNFNKLSFIGKTISEKLDSSESFEEFLSGFIIGGPGAFVNYGLGKVLQYPQRGAIREQEKMIRDAANELNKFEADPLRVFDPRVANLNNQAEFAKQMDEAVRTNNIYAYKNLQSKQMRDMIMLGMRTGKLDYMINLMEDQVNNLPEDEFKKIFNVAADATNRKSAQDYVQAFKAEAQEVVKEYDKQKQKFANPFANFKGLSKESDDYKVQAIRYHAWEEAVKDLVFERRTYADVAKRMNSILGDAQTTLGGALYNPFFTLTNKENTDKELLLLKMEIDNLKQSPQDETTKKLLAQKQKQYEGLKKWSKNTTLIDKDKFAQIDEFNESLARFTEEARESFDETLKAYQEAFEEAEMLTTEQLDQAYQYVIDFARLQKDSNTAIRNINYLTSNEGFGELYDRHYVVADAFYQNELARREKSVRLKEAVMAALELDEEFANLTRVRELRAMLDIAVEDRDYAEIEEIFAELGKIYADLRLPSEKVAADTEAQDEGTTPLTGTPPATVGGQDDEDKEGESRIFKRYKVRINNAKDRNALDKISADLSEPGKIGLSVAEAAELQSLIDDKYVSLNNVDKDQEKASIELYEKYIKILEESDTEEEIDKNVIAKFASFTEEAKANQLIIDQDKLDDLLQKALDKIEAINNGTYVPKDQKIYIKEDISKQIKEANTKEKLSELKDIIMNNFSGADKQELMDELIEKSSTFVDDTSTDNYNVNDMYDFSNIDDLNIDDISSDLDSIVDQNNKPADDQVNKSASSEDDMFDAFKNCNIPPNV
jgi:hypothetical protein